MPHQASIPKSKAAAQVTIVPLCRENDVILLFTLTKAVTKSQGQALTSLPASGSGRPAAGEAGSRQPDKINKIKEQKTWVLTTCGPKLSKMPDQVAQSWPPHRLCCVTSSSTLSATCLCRMNTFNSLLATCSPCFVTMHSVWLLGPVLFFPTLQVHCKNPNVERLQGYPKMQGLLPNCRNAHQTISKP